MLQILKSSAGDLFSTIPSLPEALPEYGGLLERQAALQTRRGAALTELRSIAQSTAPLHQVFTESVTEQKRQRRIAGLLGDAAAAKAPVVAAEDAQPPSRYFELTREIADIDDALGELDGRLRIASNKASAIICERVRTAHRQMVRDMANVLRDLHEANARYWRLSDAFNHEGVAWGMLGPAFFRPAGHPSDKSGPLGTWFHEAHADGHIAKHEIPEALR